MVVMEAGDRHEPEAGDQDTFALCRLRELLAEPDDDRPWVVEGLLPADGMSLLVAKPKVGKSTLARNLALAVARKQPFLGRPTTLGPVVYLGLEEKRDEVRRHFARMGAADEPVYVHVGRSPAKGMEALEKAIGEYEPFLVIVDTLLRLVKLRDVNDYTQVNDSMEPIMTLARNSHCHILCVHHAGKGERIGGDVVLGSTALYAAVDTLLVLKKLGSRRAVSSSQRYGREMAETYLELDEETGTITLKELVEPAGDGDLQVRVLDALQSGPKTEEDLCRLLGCDASRLNKVLQEMRKSIIEWKPMPGKKRKKWYTLLASTKPVQA